MLNNKSILITGGTGFFGQKFVKTILRKYKKIKKVIIFSRDELKQHDMVQEINDKKYKADIIVRITGDCPLIDAKLIDEGLKKYLKELDIIFGKIKKFENGENIFNHLKTQPATESFGRLN